MYCSQCGKEIADNSKFCPECGENLSSDSSGKTKSVDETSDTRKDMYGRQIYTKEERLNPKNKKKNHIWMPIGYESESNTQWSYEAFFTSLALVIIGFIIFIAYINIKFPD